MCCEAARSDGFVPIPGHTPYRINASGVVLGRWGKPLKPRIVRPSRRGNLPYIQAALYDGKGNVCMRYVHNLMLEAYVGPRPAAHEARHLNSDSLDNALTNLAWGTRAENAADRNARRTHCKRGHELGAWSKNGPKRARRCATCRREDYHSGKH